jgi:copper chaperone CopZ
MKTTRLKIDGLNCLECIERVEQALEELQGVVATDVKLNDVSIVEHADLDERKLIEAVAKAGDYRAHVVREDAVYQG